MRGPTNATQVLFWSAMRGSLNVYDCTNHCKNRRERARRAAKYRCTMRESPNYRAVNGAYSAQGMSPAKNLRSWCSMASESKNHFATIRGGRWGPRQVYYRRAGSGPAVILIHQSPRSSLDMLATMGRWKGRFSCIAPDTPGYGLSDPFGVDSITMDDMAEAAVEFMDAIGLEKAAFYGLHTGAKVAVSVGLRYPERVTCVVANGYMLPTDQERDALLANYLPPFITSWDGSHLTSLWSRYREQMIFFPWFRNQAENRFNFALPTPKVVQEILLDCMRAGDNYRIGYRAAFAMRTDRALRQVDRPLLVTAAANDILAPQLSRIGQVSPRVVVTQGGTLEQTLDLCATFIGKHRAPKPPSPPPTPSLGGRMSSLMVELPQSQLRVRRNSDASGRPVMVLHDAIGSSDIVEPISRSFIGFRPVVALDLPGHGESVTNQMKATIADQAKAVLDAAKLLGMGEFDVLGVSAGALVGLEASVLAPKRIKRLILVDTPYFRREMQARLRKHPPPSFEIDWFGGHLSHAWHFIRDQELFSLWPVSSPRDELPDPARIDPEVITRKVLEIFRAPSGWRASYMAQFTYPVRRRLERCNADILFCARQPGPHIALALQAKRDFPHAALKLVPNDPALWVHAIRDFLQDAPAIQ